MIMRTPMGIDVAPIGGRRGLWPALLLWMTAPLFAVTAARADTVASLLGNFTINQYCGLSLADDAVHVHYTAVFGQLPALRELHLADTDGNGVTSQAERDAYVGRLAPSLAAGLRLEVDGKPLPLHALKWSSSLPAEQGGFSLRVDVEFAADPPPAGIGLPRTLTLENRNYAGRMGWHEIVVGAAPGLAVYATNAFSDSLTGGLSQALTALPAGGPLDERQVRLTYRAGRAPEGTAPLTARSVGPALAGTAPPTEAIARATRRLVDAISAPHPAPGVMLAALLGALLLGAVHALSPGHGKTVVGAYLIGSRGTPRHAAFLGLTVTLTHTVGVFILGFATLYASRYVVPERLFPVLSAISAAMIFGMGCWLLLRRAEAAGFMARMHGESVFRPVDPRVVAVVMRPPLAYDATPLAGMHSHGGRMHSHLPPAGAISWRSLLTLGVSGGLVPCPSAMVLLLAAVALNKTGYGMLLVLAFSAGLALTLTAVGLLFLYARSRLPRTEAGRWQRILPLTSAAAITVVGLLLCIAAYRSLAPAGG